MDRAWKLYKNHSECYSLEAVCLLSTHKAFLYISPYKAVVYLIHSTQPTSSVTHSWSRLLPNGEQSERDELCVTDDKHAAEKLGPIALGFLWEGGGGFKFGMTYCMLTIRQVCK